MKETCRDIWRRYGDRQHLFYGVLLLSVGVACAGGYLVYRRTGWRADYFHAAAVLCLLYGVLVTGVTAYVSLIKKTHFTKMYPMLAVALSILLYMVLPVYMKPDDTHHGASVYELSNRMLGVFLEEGTTVNIRRVCDDRLGEVVTGEEYDPERQMLYPTVEDYNKVGAWFAPTKDRELATASMTKYKGGSSLPYVPGALGLTLARLLGLNFGWAALFAALCQTLFFTLCNAYAIKRTPLGKQIFFLFGMLPIVLQQVTSFSYEGALFSGCVIVMALALDAGCASDWTLHKADVCMYLLAVVLLCSAKSGAYAPLLALPFAMRFVGNARDRKRMRAPLLILLAIGLCGGMAWFFLMGGKHTVESVLTQEYYNVYVGGYGRSVAYYLQYPGQFLLVLCNTLLHNGGYYVRAMVGGSMGWRQDIVISGKVVFLIYVVLFLAMFRQPQDVKALTKGQRGALLAVGALYSLFILALMLVRWTVAESPWVDGVQGRYFLPAFLPALFAVGFWKRGKSARQGFHGNVVPQEIFPVSMALLNQLTLCVCVWMTCLH